MPGGRLDTTKLKHPRPVILHFGERDEARPKVVHVGNPAPAGTLGDLGLAVRVTGPARFPTALLVVRFDSDALAGLEPDSIRMFRADARTLKPHWNSGVNVGLNFAWAKIDRTGVYVPIGMPRDRVVQSAIVEMARLRATRQPASVDEASELAKEAFRALLEFPLEQLDELRGVLTRVEAQTALTLSAHDRRTGRGGHFDPFPLPGGVSLESFRKRLVALRPSTDGLPEEALLTPPEDMFDPDTPWSVRPGAASPDEWIDPRVVERFDRPLIDWFRRHYPWFWSQDWWMYQHDRDHSGHASGWSPIRSTTVGRMVLQSAISVDGPAITKPSIVDGKVYIGSGRYAEGGGGTLYKIDLFTGVKEGEFVTDTRLAFYSWYEGVGGSPAVIDGRAYFTSVNGKVYCVDTATMTPAATLHPAPLWVTDLKVANQLHKQPVSQPDADTWTGPVVANGRVYVGCGEGESHPTYGFIFCLDAATGDVIWCFCTAKFQNRTAPGLDNSPNVIPSSAAISDPLPAWATGAGFSIHADPLVDRSTGCSIWSSPAYDSVNNRIYIGTGNSMYVNGQLSSTVAPDKMYGSGCLSLDATTGDFRGFHQSQSDDSYWPHDGDIDVPGSPTLLWVDGTRAVAYGCKNGSFFVLDAATMVPLARRQLLPRTGGSGLPGDRGTGIAGVVPDPGTGYLENDRGIMGTPAVHYGLNRIFVGLGGYNGMNLDGGGPGTDPTRTPFMRALNWNDLTDAWPTVLGADNVARYTTTKPPMYTTLEVALSSPAVVHDVVFVSTDKAGLYALDAGTGLCLWSAPGLPAGPQAFTLGPAIYGDRVVVGSGSTVFIYRLNCRRPWRPPWLEPVYKLPWPPPHWPWPWPPPPPPWQEAEAINRLRTG
jgi:outer membrane protein assembly factor BamB